MTGTKRFTRLALFAGTALNMLAAPAFAQDTAPAPGAAAVEVVVEEAAPGVDGEIVVTARRRAESLKDVPIAVTAYTGAQLEQAASFDITDIGDTTPNVTLEASRGTNSTLTAFIRGIGQQDPVAGFEQGVGIYLDDVYLNRPQGAVLDIYDVERIEVLRGPQGTLYGRNTIGGAIKYVTRRLSNDPTLSVRGAVGTYGQLDLVASASYPVADLLRIGVAGARLTRDGFGRNFTTGDENYNKNVRAGRVSAEIGTDERAFLRLSADYTKDTSNPRGGHRLITSLLTAQPVLDNVFNTRGGLDTPSQKVISKGAAAHGQITIADGLVAKSITSLRKDTSFTPIDFDALPAADLDVPAIYRNKQFSQELQLAVSRGPLSGVLGAYYLDAKATTEFDVRLFTTFPGFAALTFGNVKTKTWALFGDFTYDVSDQLAVSLGGRFTNDKREATVFRASYLGGGSTTFGGTQIPFGLPTSNFEGERKDRAFTPRASVSFKPNADHHFYLSGARGFKGGGFDPRGQTTAAADTNGDGIRSADEIYEFMAFDPEKVTSFEAGWKASLFDRRLYSAVALFRASYDDMQIPGSVGCVIAGQPNFCGVTTNAAKSRIRGVEWEANARLFGNPTGQRVNLAWTVGYLDAEFKKYIDARGIDVAKRREIQNTPKWTASSTLSYAAPLYQGELNLSGTWSYRSSSQQFEVRTPLLDQKGFSLFDANATYALPGGHWVVGLHGKNLANKKYIASGYNFLRQNPDTGDFILANGQPGFSSMLGREGTLTAYYGNPRQIIFTVGYKF